LDISPIVLNPACLTLDAPELPVSIFDYKIIPTIISKRCKDAITNFYELCYDDSFTQLSYRFIVLPWSELSHYIFPFYIMMTVIKKAAISYSLLRS
jgi:hypothetical protein